VTSVLVELDESAHSSVSKGLSLLLPRTCSIPARAIGYL
jgi:hypothetical protein